MVQHEPSGACTTSVKGRVVTPTPIWLAQGTVPVGGLKLITGKDCVNTGRVVASKTPLPEFVGLAKNSPLS
jgi:hypothetical protein